MCPYVAILSLAHPPQGIDEPWLRGKAASALADQEMWQQLPGSSWRQTPDYLNSDF